MVLGSCSCCSCFCSHSSCERSSAKHDDDDDGGGLLRSLLAQYMTDGTDAGAVPLRALRLLERYADQLSATAALGELPDGTPVSAIGRYLVRARAINAAPGDL